MKDFMVQRMRNPMNDIKVDLGVDYPLWVYIKKAVQDIEVINMLSLYPVDDEKSSTYPFIHVLNWAWNPHPLAEEIQYRRRETCDKLSTKTIGDSRVGILTFDVFGGARDKNRIIQGMVVHNKIYIPIEDDNGRYLLDNILYSEYQLVDKLLYPSGKDSITLKSLLPIVISYEECTEQSVSGYMITGKIGMVKIFKTMEPILSCFMHIPAPLSYLEVFPILQFCDHISEHDQSEFEYFQPIEGADIYVKAHREGIEKFAYVRGILVMAISIIRKHQPPSIDELRDPKWWVYELSYYDNIIEHRGACHEMHVARMLDTISAQVLPIPQVDKRCMIALLRYVLQTEFINVDIYSYVNKRIRSNEVISTIVTANVSEKLKKMFKYGRMIKTKDMESNLKFHPQILLKNLHNTQTVHAIDFANDLDYPQQLRWTKNGPNSLGRLDKHKISLVQRQMHPSMIGLVDMLHSSKDVGQSGMISPWANIDAINNVDVNKYPNIKFELFRFIQDHFPVDLTFNADNIVDYNKILDRLVMSAYINLNYKVDTIES